MKKPIAVTLTVLLLLALLPALPVQAYYTSGDWSYLVEDDSAILWEYNGPGGRLVIPSELDGYRVTTIGRYLCYDRKDLESVVIPDSVVEIDTSAFENCNSLSQVTLPKSPLSIGEYAFSGCSALTQITLPEGLLSIDSYAFYESALERVTVPSTIEFIGKNAFGSCKLLSAVEFSQGVTEIGDGSFRDCPSLKSVTIPSSVTRIGKAAFISCLALEHIELPEGIIELAASAFQNTGLTQVTIPFSVDYIGNYVFAECRSLVSISIPGSVSHIGDRVFYGCVNLVSVNTVEAKNKLIPMASNNANRNNYRKTAAAVNSYLYRNDDGYLRVEAIDSRVLVEQYTEDFRLLSSQWLPGNLTNNLWGGFFAGENAYFSVTGRANPDESDNISVISVHVYRKDWKLYGEAMLSEINTYIPFRGGSLRCAEYNGVLFIYTCHEMYNTGDGYHHQTNMRLAMRESDLEFLDMKVGITDSDGFVSHSFNQFILIDSAGRIVTLDHGDGNPRSAVLMRYSSNADTGGFRGGVSKVAIQAFPGAIGDNTTGASLGGLAETTTGYVTAYNYNGLGSTTSGLVMGVTSEDPNPIRSVYLSWTAKDDFTASGTQVHKIMEYPADGSVSSGTPMLVPTGTEGGWVLWSELDLRDKSTGTIRYARYGADGSIGEICAVSGTLSDCQPVPVGDSIVWYYTDGGMPVFNILAADGSMKSINTADGSVSFNPGKNEFPEDEISEDEPLPEPPITDDSAIPADPTGIRVLVMNTPIVWTDVEPFIDANNRTMIPLRAVGEALSLDVSWDGAAREAVFTDGKKTLFFPIGSTNARTGDGGTLQMDTVAIIVNDRTFAPVRFLAEYFGWSVDWDGTARTVLIN